ncbi:hypothetical protein [Chryseobacterium gleum]|uniref:hypothetical protein n=1 Tax=Chryseobacterium gleum TaxID=250 RepID=UPI001E51CE72|nr:hypothetical protein [Chryseobacterium gleum]MCD9617908.1 hypothetical protein [Chryseobacterium gleum]
MNKHYFKEQNYVILLGNEYQITNDDINYIEKIDTNEYQPIFLTEYWIKKLGFIKLEIESKYEHFVKDVNKNERLRIIKDLDIFKEIHLDYLNGYRAGDTELITTRTEFFFVHKLQNLISDHSKPDYPFKK